MLDADKAKSILNEIAADEWNRPILDHLAAQWAITRITELENLVTALNDRIETNELAAKKRRVRK